MYKARYWLTKTMYIAEVNNRLVLVKTDAKGNIIKAVIFGKERSKA